MNQEELSTKIKEALKDSDIYGIVKSVTSKFRHKLSQDELKSCSLSAISDAIKNYDPTKKSKFTTYLHKGLQIQCLTQLKKNEPIHINYWRAKKNNIDYSFETKKRVMEVVDELKNIHGGEIVLQKFLMNYSNSEIAEKHNIHPETVRIKIKNILKSLRLKMR
jgi:DNA-directed RNA polymerase specialized sigma subunit